MKYKIFIDKRAQKQLESLSSDSNSAIHKKLLKLKEGFLPELDIKKLKGYRNHYRLRVGGHRVLFELHEGHEIIIFAVLPRKKAYK
ncbi:type II toxin-antitoxin system RelE family toxin [Methanobacterium aggregans]|uniref:type II toxin-antitoxin system RelE family toxin n=1 Tax=Methanobacterium aggregans TaxID=1615586 RepID=UPI001AE5BAA0|nr:type II toxin-antitoxin system RelE/ParE family toxin [Methanobacterium aggregans]MBP2046759.1 mRNA interferase RelE/StbE [Methanobacterium aggregans]